MPDEATKGRTGERADGRISAPSPLRPFVPSSRLLHVQHLGTVPYADALALQADLVQKRRAGEIGDQLLLLEHPHVITLGTASHQENVLLDEAERRLLGIELFETGRGGDVTYHGPGQLVGYPILDLKPDRQDLHRYVRDIEEALIGALRAFGLECGRKPGLTGVWLADEKIAAIGVRVSSGWITSHGFALNVSNDLRFFDSIVPCGIKEFGVTSIQRATGQPYTINDTIEPVSEAFAAIFGAAVA